MRTFRKKASHYDNGDTAWAKDLATAASILVDDSRGGRTVSLLTQLDIRSKISWVSSISEPMLNPRNLGWKAKNGLIKVRAIGKEATYAPKLEPVNEVYRKLDFNSWYDERIFIGIHLSSDITRQNLIHYLRSQDGGAHVDGKLTNKDYHDWKFFGYPALSYGVDSSNGLNIYGPLIDIRTGQAVPDQQFTPIPNSVRAAMRQVAWEIETSISEIGF
jgi:hypothetical protein